MAANRGLGRGPPNITTSGCLEMVGLCTLIQERLPANTCFYPRTAVNCEWGKVVFLALNNCHKT